MPSALLTVPLPQSGESRALWGLEKDIPPGHPISLQTAAMLTSTGTHILGKELSSVAFSPSYTKTQQNQLHFLGE